MSAFCGGISLGTTNSVIATYQRDAPECVLTMQVRHFFPSVISINKKNEVSIGEAAAPYMLSPTYFSIRYAKRVIGYHYNSERVKSNPSICIAKMRESKDGKVEFYKEGWDVTETPISVYVKLLKNMLDRTEVLRGKRLDKVVVTVPIHFKQEQIADTEEAIRQVGFTKENYMIMKEPIAAVFCYGLEKLRNGYTLVYHLGGSSFSSTILQITNNAVKVCGYGHDEMIGGLAFDEIIRDWVIKEVKGITGKEICDSRSRNYTRKMQKLLKSCCEAKEELVAFYKINIDLFDIASEDVLEVMEDIELTSERMEKLLDPFIKRTIEIVYHTIQKAGLQKEDIKQILMVGGSSRLRCVHSALKEHFGWDVSLELNVSPDKVVALGAAKACHIWAGN